jgi:hypothetical protein
MRRVVPLHYHKKRRDLNIRHIFHLLASETTLYDSLAQKWMIAVPAASAAIITKNSIKELLV